MARIPDLKRCKIRTLHTLAAPSLCSIGTLSRWRRHVAQAQGRTAAKNMLGKFLPYSTVPEFWTDVAAEGARRSLRCLRAHQRDLSTTLKAFLPPRLFNQVGL